MDADRYGIKRIKEIVGEDGSVVIRVYLLDPKTTKQTFRWYFEY